MLLPLLVGSEMGRRIDPSWWTHWAISPWYLLSCLWDVAYKRTLVAKLEKIAHVAAAGFLSRYLSGPLPYV